MKENQMPDPMALRMNDCPDHAAAYENGRDEVFRERRVALKRLGASHDAIWLDPADGQRCGILTHALDAVAGAAITKRRRALRPAIVQCHPNHALVLKPLRQRMDLP